MSQKYTLYGRPGSGSLAVQVALEEIGAPYQRVWIGREPADVASYRTLNPTGRVPALGLPDGTVMFESAAILIHLALAHPDAKLGPRPGTRTHAQFLQWMVFLSANVYEAALRIYYADRYSTHGAAGAEPIRQRAAAEFGEHLDLIARQLDPYVLGGELSAADLYLHMLGSWYPGERAERDARFPRLAVLDDILRARPSISKVAADHAE
ncbi:MAG: glutathione S-transferase family protein [Gammaproteobacteria bacterium]|nr:glutathione S-transferase family protein [Gammaproteobacteria bacterium]